MSTSDLKNRFDYHKPNEDKVLVHERVRAYLLDVAEDLDKLLPDCREKSLVLTKLEEAMFWSNAAVARN